MSNFRKGDWGDEYPETVKRLYEWAHWLRKDPMRDMKLGFPTSAAFAKEYQAGYPESRTIADSGIDEERALETERFVMLTNDMTLKSMLIWYYGSRLTYVELARTYNTATIKEQRPSMSDKDAKSYIGRAVAMVEQCQRLLTVAREAC